jgi:hypothetical protein
VHLTTASPPVPVHVTVSAGSSWISVALSTAALVLAVVSIGWQAYTFRRSGSRVLVHARFAMDPEGFDATGRPAGFRFPADTVMAGMPPGQLRRLSMVAVIQNVGRQAVTIRRCTWRSDSFMVEEAPAIGQQFPHRLEPDDECFSAIMPDMIRTLFASGDASAMQRIWPEVELGNGRTVRGRPLVLPALTTNPSTPS